MAWHPGVREKKLCQVLVQITANPKAFIMISSSCLLRSHQLTVYFQKAAEILLHILLGRTFIPHEELYFLSQTKFSAEQSRRSFRKDPAVALSYKRREFFFLAFEHFCLYYEDFA